jgi:hypothetical protein
LLLLGVAVGVWIQAHLKVAEGAVLGVKPLVRLFLLVPERLLLLLVLGVLVRPVKQQRVLTVQTQLSIQLLL